LIAPQTNFSITLTQDNNMEWINSPYKNHIEPPAPKVEKVPWTAPPSHLPEPTPLYILRKYTGIFCAPISTASTHKKSIAITLTKNLLYFQHLPDVEIEKMTCKIGKKGKGKADKGKPTVHGKGKVTKKVTTPKKATKTATAAALSEARCTGDNPVAQKKKTITAATTLSEIMATKASASKPMTPKAAALPPPPAVPSISATAGLGADTAAARTPISTPTAPSLATGCLLFIAINGCPQVHVSGSTPEETEKNKELNAVGLLHEENELVTFDVKDGEIRGVRVKGEMYVRVTEVE
jgi:hypothetical protein